MRSLFPLHHDLPNRDILIFLTAVFFVFVFGRFGQRTVQTCTHCTAQADYALHALPPALLSYTLAAAVLGTVTVRGSGREARRSIGIMMLVFAGLCEAYWAYTVPIIISPRHKQIDDIIMVRIISPSTFQQQLTPKKKKKKKHKIVARPPLVPPPRLVPRPPFNPPLPPFTTRSTTRRLPASPTTPHTRSTKHPRRRAPRPRPPRASECCGHTPRARTSRGGRVVLGARAARRRCGASRCGRACRCGACWARLCAAQCTRFAGSCYRGGEGTGGREGAGWRRAAHGCAWVGGDAQTSSTTPTLSDVDDNVCMYNSSITHGLLL